ncbi:hypothetical protein UT300003_26340 [Clostridium sardiniense]
MQNFLKINTNYFSLYFGFISAMNFLLLNAKYQNPITENTIPNILPRSPTPKLLNILYKTIIAITHPIKRYKC